MTESANVAAETVTLQRKDYEELFVLMQSLLALAQRTKDPAAYQAYQRMRIVLLPYEQ